MSSREVILEALLKNQPVTSPLPDISLFGVKDENPVEKYMDMVRSIGGAAYLVNDMASVKRMIQEQFDVSNRMITTFPDLADIAEQISTTTDPHTLQDVELAVISAHFGVAENGAVWLTEELMRQRIVPYICQHLVVVLCADSIVPTLHEAYETIGEGNYGFGGFIGGPSKTADIEQALVLGAHGPLSMTVFILNNTQNNL